MRHDADSAEAVLQICRVEPPELRHVHHHRSVFDRRGLGDPLVAVRRAEVPLLVILEIFRQRLRHQHAEDLLRDVLVGGAFGILL